ncbi:hypothetical protein NQ317_006324 [Molorchus minor]|uniref:AMP-dependent synthetase/ligase domain-containing protein n=1 Tax=Molorchus minor TaxID=1323400 RepID=A0ABQ9J9W6_9CUCU|nr:hypothetical protein NQ317_006324 [Molorchus minor]
MLMTHKAPVLVYHENVVLHVDVGDGQSKEEKTRVSPAARAVRRGNRRLTRNESRYHSGRGNCLTVPSNNSSNDTHLLLGPAMGSGSGRVSGASCCKSVFTLLLVSIYLPIQIIEIVKIRDDLNSFILHIRCDVFTQFSGVLEVRQEAVQQALAQAMQNRHKPSMPMPSKRTSVMARSPERDRHDSESSSDEDSIVNEETVESTPEREKARDRSTPQMFPPPPLSDTSSTGSPPPLHHRPRMPPPNNWDQRNRQEITNLSDVMQNFKPYSQPPDVTHNTAQDGRRAGADRVNRYASSASDDTMGTEFYEDDDIELEIAANPKDPNAPKPEGSCMSPAVGEQLIIPSGLPRSLEAAITRYGNATYKAPVATVLDPNGKLSTTLTFGKLLSRSHKVAYALLTKSFSKNGDTSLKSGDRVALVYPNNDPINFLCAFYGCLQAGIVPIGFLLGSCAVQVALTSEACLKGLPKTTSGEVIQFKGWPKLTWFVTEHLARTPKDWVPTPRLTDETSAYIEYSTDKDGSVMGVTITKAAVVQHCRMLTMACNYTEERTCVLNGMHVIYIPYALMKVNPASWMQMITKHKACVAVVKSRDLHWGLLATKDHKDINLSSLRMLLVADGANPWSLSSCDQFLSVFQSKGLKADAICPCASSSECLTVSVRRPGRGGVNATGRGVLSMQGLSYGVVRVDQENSLTSLTLQDCGQVMPGCVIVVVKMEGPAYLCKTDEVGEICVNSGATGAQYWGLQGLSNSTFKVQPLGTDGKTISDAEYIRSGLLGFLGPGGLVFVCGSRDGLMTVTGRKHNADDIIATVLAVEPMKFIYRGRIAVFSIRVLRDERICVIAEQRPDCSEEEKSEPNAPLKFAKRWGDKTAPLELASMDLQLENCKYLFHLNNFSNLQRLNHL